MRGKHRLIGWSLRALGATRAHRLFGRGLRGLGAILMFHHVRPFLDRGFAPNRELEITPEFLDGVLWLLRRLGWRIATLDEAVTALGQGGDSPPIAALTFDDGYRDFEEWALPILKRESAPATLFVTTGFADRTVAPWWICVEQALARLDEVTLNIDGDDFTADIRTLALKERAGARLMPILRKASEPGRIRAVAALVAASGLDARQLTEELCLDWSEIALLAREPLLTIGAHSTTHPMLARQSETEARAEIAGSRAVIASQIGHEVRHFAYPVGDASVAGLREFRLAAHAGFASGLTTRPGMLFPEHAAHPMALPRLSINGRHQNLAALEALLSGGPFFAFNGLKRLNLG